MNVRICSHQFIDGSGSVFFNVDSGETLTVSLSLKDFIEQLNAPCIEVKEHRYNSVMLALIKKEDCISLSSPTDGICA